MRPASGAERDRVARLVSPDNLTVLDPGHIRGQRDRRGGVAEVDVDLTALEGPRRDIASEHGSRRRCAQVEVQLRRLGAELVDAVPVREVEVAGAGRPAQEERAETEVTPALPDVRELAPGSSHARRRSSPSPAGACAAERPSPSARGRCGCGARSATRAPSRIPR